jgi:regulator of replication initiation timing
MFNLNDLKKISSILSPSGLYDLFKNLLGAYEKKVQEVEDLKDEVSRLQDRLQKLIGEKEKPKFEPKKNEKNLHHPKPPKDNEKKNWEKSSKNNDIKIDRKENCPVDKDSLPSDAKFKGTRKVIIQNLVIKTENVEFSIDRWYSPSKQKYYEGKLPSGFQGSQFGPDLRSLVISNRSINPS